MKNKIALNTRCLLNPLSGVQRYTHQVSNCFSGAIRVKPSFHRFSSGFAGHLWEQFSLPAKLQGRLLFSPANTGPLLVANQVVTIHDVATLDHPEWFSRKFAQWYNYLLPNLIKVCKSVITVSEASRQRILFHCPEAEAKLKVVHNGINESFYPAKDSGLQRIKELYSLNKPYFLYVGSMEPRKNLSVLLKAWDKAGLADGFDLVLAGGFLSRVFAQRQHVSLPSGTRAIGRFEDSDLCPLYSGATALVYPSLYEGFGFPVLEAMRCGTIPIFSAIPSHFEISRGLENDERLVFDPHSENDLEKILQHVANMTAVEKKYLSVRYQKHAEQFTWQRCARETAAVLEAAMDQ